MNEVMGRQAERAAVVSWLMLQTDRFRPNRYECWPNKGVRQGKGLRGGPGMGGVARFVTTGAQAEIHVPSHP